LSKPDPAPADCTAAAGAEETGAAGAAAAAAGDGDGDGDESAPKPRRSSKPPPFAGAVLATGAGDASNSRRLSAAGLGADVCPAAFFNTFIWLMNTGLNCE